MVNNGPFDGETLLVALFLLERQLQQAPSRPTRKQQQHGYMFLALLVCYVRAPLTNRICYKMVGWLVRSLLGWVERL